MDKDRYTCKVYKMMLHDSNCCNWASKSKNCCFILILMMCGKPSLRMILNYLLGL